jgi:hypothetical protein
MSPICLLANGARKSGLQTFDDGGNGIFVPSTGIPLGVPNKDRYERLRLTAFSGTHAIQALDLSGFISMTPN